MAITTADQVTYASGITVSGTAYPFGAVLPAPAGPDDAAVRAALRSAGVLRAVTATATNADFNNAVDAAVATAPPGIVETIAGTGVTVIAAPGT